MSETKIKKRSLRGELFNRLLAGTAASIVAALPAAAAEGSAIIAAATPSQTTPEQVIIQGQRPADYKIDTPALSKLTEPLLDTPQTIDTISQQELSDRAVTNLADALRNVPSISLGAGEFMFAGNNPSIREFVARTDMYLDGIRDGGNYYRDPFNLEQIEVLEGPASILFGRGSTGGVINQSSKRPQTEAITEGTAVFGSDMTRRATVDIDRPIPELNLGAAFRITAMGHQADLAGHDGAKFKRFGFAPSLALGLGSPTRLTLSYFHQSANDVPDYGFPWYFGRPAPVDRNNFYGYTTDYFNTVADIGTAKFEHDFAPNIVFHTTFRAASYTREERITQAWTGIPAGTTINTPLDTINVNRSTFGGHAQEQFLQNQTDVTAHFDTGFISHALVAGFEASHERSAPQFDNGLSVPPTSLLHPEEASVFPTGMFERFHADTRANGYGVFALDTIKFGSIVDVVLGARWDRYEVDYRSETFSVPPAALGNIVATNNQKRTDEAPSYRAAVVYKPLPFGSVYATFGTSFNPSAENVSLLTSGEFFTVSNQFLSPEKNKSYEIGTKWNLLDNRIMASAALFRIEKTNARVPDPTRPGFNTLAGEQRVDGFEILFDGYLTRNWQVSGGYTYLDAKLVKTLTAGAPAGTPLLNAPENSFTFWTTYAFDMGLMLGGGGKYIGERYAQTTNPRLRADGYWSFDAMAKYLVTQNISVQLNVTNIANAVYFDQLHPHFVIPGAGRTALLTLQFKY